METNKLYSCIILIFYGLAAFLMSGCAAKQENPVFTSARDTFTQIQDDPQINRYAPLELQEAKVAFENAQRSWEAENDVTEVEHLAYLAKQKALIARETATMKMADKELEAASAERNKVLLSAREEEANQALKKAQQRAVEAEKARDETLIADEKAKKLEIEAEKAREEALVADEKAEKLEAQIADLQAKQTQRGLVLTMGDVLFDTGKSSLKPGACLTIEKLAVFLKEYPNRNVRIEGFTDSVGSEEFNLGLSIRRAEAVRNALNRLGIELDRILYHGYGEMYPVASNDTAEGRQHNRRVEIVISDEKGVIPDRIR
ncbi:MAG: hypothetical protein AVO38_13340 [delta proteobacterium ML8_D]|nr:MAG: hypothetical protein AVO38_13340 [delta proteobacterium ML8_D]